MHGWWCINRFISSPCVAVVSGGCFLSFSLFLVAPGSTVYVPINRNIRTDNRYDGTIRYWGCARRAVTLCGALSVISTSDLICKVCTPYTYCMPNCHFILLIPNILESYQSSFHSHTHTVSLSFICFPQWAPTTSPPLSHVQYLTSPHPFFFPFSRCWYTVGINNWAD